MINAVGPVHIVPSSRRVLSRSSMSDDSAGDDSNDFDDHTSYLGEDSDDGGESPSNLTSYWDRRDKRQAMRNFIITKMEVGLGNLEDELETLKIELDFRSCAGEAARAEHKTKFEEKTNRNECLKVIINKVLYQETERRSSLSTYVSTMRGVTGPGSMYVQTVEGQLCRSLHLLGVRKKQRDLMNRHANEMIHYMKKVIKEQDDEKAELFRRVMTQSFEVGCEKRNYAKRCDIILKNQRFLIENLQAKAWQASFSDTDWMCPEELPSRSFEIESHRPRRRASIGFSSAIADQSKRELCPRSMSTENVDEGAVNEMIEEVKEQPNSLNRLVSRSSLGDIVSSFNSFTRRLSVGSKTPTLDAEHDTAENNTHTSTAVSVAVVAPSS